MLEHTSALKLKLRQDVNALRSGGPRTEEGKAASSRNSLAHGLTAKQVVIPGESQADFDELHHNLIKDRKPEGELEVQLTGEIAACLWRLARARQHEAGILNRHGLYDHSASRLCLVMRYIGSIERQLNRTIVRLEHLQNERRKSALSQAEAEPPPKAMVAGATGASTIDTPAAPEFVSSSDYNTPRPRPVTPAIAGPVAPIPIPAIRKFGS